MLTLSDEQFETLEAESHTRFVVRLDGFLLQHLGKRWAKREVDRRRKLIRISVRRGLTLGIDQEVYVAQFVLVHMIRGEAFLQGDDARRIIQHERLSWRQRMFQLVTLAGIDLSEGAPAAA